MKDKLDYLMEVYGFKRVRYPTGNSYSYWYVKNKIPYNSAISKEQIEIICKEYKALRE